MVLGLVTSDAMLNAALISSELMPVVNVLLDADMIIFPPLICYLTNGQDLRPIT